MNTIQNLIDNGIDFKTAQRMLVGYSQKVGTYSGIYLITDVYYDFEIKGKIVKMKCSSCGKKIERKMFSGKNKWSELIKSCECQKELEKIQKQNKLSEKLEKNKKEQKAIIFSRVGVIFGDYKIIAIDDLDKNQKYTMQCTQCGNEKIVLAEYFDKRKNFECHNHFEKEIKFDESYIGKKNNLLKVIGITRKSNKRFFVCTCDCGNIKLVEPAIWEQGIVKSCGCLKESMKIEHSEEIDRLCRIYSGMKQRCYNNNSEAFYNYGKRGIKICDEWNQDRKKFIEWALNNGYQNDLTIDRIDVNGDYEPSNCRWATWDVQRENRRPREQWKERRKSFELDGIFYYLYELCKIYDTSEPAVKYRMDILGMTLEEALKKPKSANGRPRKEKV